MSTQQDIYAAGSENHPPMLNKENYVPWSSRLLRYAKSRPNGKLIYNSIMNSPYVRRMIPEPGDPDREVPVPEMFHEQTNDELTEAEIKQMEGDDQAIQTILLGLLEYIYAAVDSCETAQEIYRHVTIVHQTKDLHTSNYTRLYDFLKYNQKEVDDLRAERLAKTQDPLALMEISNNPFNYPVFHPDQPSSSIYMQQPQPNNNYNPQPSFNYNYMQQPMPNPEDITDPTTAMNMALVLMAKAFKLNYSTPTNNNQRILSNPHNRHIAQPGMNMGQDRQMQMVRGNGGNHFRQIQNRNDNVVAAQAEGNANGNNGNQIRCYKCRGLGHLARNCTIRLRKRDAAYLQTQLLIAQKEEAGIQLQDDEFDLMAAIADIDEIEEVNANCILMANLQQASTSVTQTDKAPVYDSDRSAKEKSTVSSLLEEKKRLKSDFKIREDELLDKQIQLENKIKELDNILVKTEAAKFVRDFKSLANEADESLAKAQDIGMNVLGLIFQAYLGKKRVDNTAKTRRPQPRSNTKNDRVPSVSKSSCNKNKEVKVEEHHRNLLLYLRKETYVI
ncbi:retrovirus-related pol polyprotein from transposon TNT 1-94 [Tanacetum coccineum]